MLTAPAHMMGHAGVTLRNGWSGCRATPRAAWWHSLRPCLGPPLHDRVERKRVRFRPPVSAVSTEATLSILSRSNPEPPVVSADECRFGLIADTLGNHGHRRVSGSYAIPSQRKSELREKCEGRPPHRHVK